MARSRRERGGVGERITLMRTVIVVTRPVPSARLGLHVVGDDEPPAGRRCLQVTRLEQKRGVGEERSGQGAGVGKARVARVGRGSAVTIEWFQPRLVDTPPDQIGSSDFPPIVNPVLAGAGGSEAGHGDSGPEDDEGGGG